MTDKDYLYVLTIAKLGNFTRAAEKLYISQPALSRYISTLEKRLNTTLFIRTPYSITITSSGKTFCEYAERILSLEDELVNKLKEYYPNINIGKLYWNAGSIHVYERHFKFLEK